MDQNVLLSQFRPTWLGTRLECHGLLPSTNDRARELLDQLGPEAHGAVIFADAQSSGRGRLGRAWVSPPALSLSMSVALWIESPKDALPLLPVAGSLAVLRALKESADLDAGLKWPNDVLCRGKKIAGALSEGRWSGGRLEGLVLGIGVNLGQKREDFPEELREGATSVLIESGLMSESECFAAELLRELDPLLEAGLEDPEALLSFAARHWVHRKGDLLSAWWDGDVVGGTFVEVAPDGALILEDRGRHVTVRAGDVRDVRRAP
jgi:BirA family transcriptional regulator, biotin operon repressor / biotin---[acetyl-CoA-carboxylase] ligase